MKGKTGQAGVTLIEVLITVLILASSLLAMATLQTRSLQFNQDAYVRAQTNILAYDILDRIRVNGGTLSTDDEDNWGALVAQTIPNGDGEITCAGPTCTVTFTMQNDQFDGEESSLSFVARM